MKIEYIVVLKEPKETKTSNDSPTIKEVLSTCFDNVQVNNFEISYKRKDYLITYEGAIHKTNIDNRSNFVYYLTFSYGTSKNEINASILDFIHLCFLSKINSGKYKFHITICYDERALYFCSKAYPYFCEFESTLRCLILKLLTQTFGIFWAQKTLTNEQTEKIKEKTRSGNFEKIASEALYEMDFYSLQSYLFDKTREIPPEYIIDNNLSPDLLKELTIDEISVILDLARPKSNWEKYFAEKIRIEKLEDKLTVIREERNKIAHIKHYSRKDFIEDKEILCDFNIKLNEAIRSIEVTDLTTEEAFDAIVTFGSFISDCISIGRGMKKALEVFADVLSSIPKFDFSSIQATQSSMSKLNLPLLQETQANVLKTNLPTLQNTHFPFFKFYFIFFHII